MSNYKPTKGNEVKSFDAARNDNGELIADVAKLHLDVNMKAVDLTFGEGVWWKNWKPRKLIVHDLDVDKGGDGVDFRRTHHRANSFDLVSFDPPYVAMGGRATSKLAYKDQYGMVDAPRTPIEVREYIAAGLTECHRIVRPRGIVLAKCMNYVSSNKLQPGLFWAYDDAMGMGFKLVDLFYFPGEPGQQPGGRNQNHARNNVSMLLVLTK